MVSDYPAFSDIWPFREVTIPPQLAVLPLEVFFTDRAPDTVTAASWLRVTDPNMAPRAGYALRLTRDNGKGSLARWDTDAQVWVDVTYFPVPTSDWDCAIIELNGIVLGNVASTEDLEARVKVLLAKELSNMTTYRLTAMVFSLASIMTLFFSVRAGVESRAIEPFALIFGLAVCAGMTAGFLKTRAKASAERGLTRIRDQFQFEYRSTPDQPLRMAHVNGVLLEMEARREEAALVIGFLLLLCFVYFVSPLMVVSVIVSLILVTLITGSPKTQRGLAMAYDRAEQRLEHALLSFRAGNDAMSTPALRRAKKQVLRDRIRRHADVRTYVQHRQGRLQFNQDLAFALAFVIIFGSYALTILTGIQKLAPGLGSSLVNTSLFSVAPIIVLLSVARSTSAMAKVVNRQLSLLAR